MSNLSKSEKAVLFLNNLAGDDLWEHGNEMLPQYQNTHIPHELFKYKQELNNVSKPGGVYITTVPYTLQGFGNIQIYGFPFLSISIDPFDIEYPVPIQALVITEDVRMFDYLMEQDPGFVNSIDPHFSRLAWARTQNIPTILAVHHAEGHIGDLDKLRMLVGMEIFCPVVWHDGDLNANFLQRAISTVLSEIKQI